MKKIFIVVLIVIAIILCGTFEQIYVKNSLLTLQSKVDEIQSLLQDEKMLLALDKTIELKNWWYKKRDILEFICPNNEIKDFAKEIGELHGSIVSSADSDPITRCVILKEMAKNSYNLLAFKWKNIL